MADSQVNISFNTVDITYNQTTPDRPIRTSIPNAPERVRSIRWYDNPIFNPESQAEEQEESQQIGVVIPEIFRRFNEPYEEPADDAPNRQINQQDEETSQYEDEYEEEDDYDGDLCPGCGGFIQCRCHDDYDVDDRDYDYDEDDYIHYCGDRSCNGDCGVLDCGCIDTCRGRCGRYEYD